MTDKQHWRELRERLERGQLVLFIGADLPQETTGLPSRADLARELARRKGLNESLPLAEVAQRVSRVGNRWEFTNFIREALDIAGKRPQAFHRCVVELVKAHRIKTIITTAYDNLLEKAFEEAGVGINRVVDDSSLAFVRPDRPTLIKLYGDAQQPESLVVTDSDHFDLLRDRDREGLMDEVRRALRLNTVLFIGYNLADPDFLFIFSQIAENRFARTTYAVWPEPPAADVVQMWRDRGVVILDSAPFGIWGGSGAPATPSDRPAPDTIPLCSGFAPRKRPIDGGAPSRVKINDGVDFVWNQIAIREQLTAAFDDPGLDAFCMDHFPQVFDKFSRGMRKDEKITLLLDHCRRSPARRQKLLAVLEEDLE